MNRRRSFFKKAAAFLGGMFAGPAAMADDKLTLSFVVPKGVVPRTAPDNCLLMRATHVDFLAAWDHGVTMRAIFGELFDRGVPVLGKRICMEITVEDLAPGEARTLAEWEDLH